MVSRIMHVISANPVKDRVFVIMKDVLRPTKSHAIAKIISNTCDILREILKVSKKKKMGNSWQFCVHSYND